MDEIYFNQCILCDVKNCEHYHEEHCKLGQIKVSHEKNSTICASFKKND